MISNRLRDRIRDRLDVKGLNPFEAARMAGLERSFLNDLLIGKKQTIRQRYLPAIASTLDCDPGYLSGSQNSPRKQRGEEDRAKAMVLAGICEAGAWRDAGIDPPEADPLPIEPDFRYPAEDQVCYLVRGDHAAGLAITDGSVVCAATLAAIEDAGRSLRHGDVVIVERRDDRGRREISIRSVEEGRSGTRLIAKPARGDIPAISPDQDTKILGLALRAIRVFGLPV